VTTVRPLGDLDDLLGLTDHHPVVRWDVGSGFTGGGWAAVAGTDAAVVFLRRSDHGVPGAATLGGAAGLDALFADPRVRDWFHDSGAQHLSAPREHQPVVARRLDLGDRGGDWDWMWTTEPPPTTPGEEDVVTLDESTREELTGFLTTHSPRTHGQPFARPDQWWVGLRDGAGRLVACGAAEPSEAGTPTLAGIATDTALRRRGLGAAVTAHLARRAVADHGACALGMYSDNDVARRVYTRLGFRTGMRWRSRWLPTTVLSRGTG
jgi:GNAT superfamily N-acetyltransferase